MSYMNGKNIHQGKAVWNIFSRVYNKLGQHLFSISYGVITIASLDPSVFVRRLPVNSQLIIMA